jgi:uncharacterized protein involved in copper resistance
MAALERENDTLAAERIIISPKLSVKMIGRRSRHRGMGRARCARGATWVSHACPPPPH